MAAPTTYAELKMSLTSFIDRGTDLDSYRDDFIDFAEADFNRKIRTRQMIEIATLTTDSGGDATLPTDFIVPISVVYSSSPNVELQPVALGITAALNPYAESGDPRYYQIKGEAGVQELHVTPIKASATIIVRYYEKIPALSDGTTTNWLLTAQPELYLYRARAKALIFMQDMQAASMYEQYTDRLMDEMNGINDLAIYANAGLVYTGPAD